MLLYEEIENVVTAGELLQDNTQNYVYIGVVFKGRKYVQFFKVTSQMEIVEESGKSFSAEVLALSFITYTDVVVLFQNGVIRHYCIVGRNLIEK